MALRQSRAWLLLLQSHNPIQRGDQRIGGEPAGQAVVPASTTVPAEKLPEPAEPLLIFVNVFAPVLSAFEIVNRLVPVTSACAR